MAQKQKEIMAAKQMKLDPGIWEDYLSLQESKLPQLDDIGFSTNRVIRTMGENPGAMQLQGTNTYLVGTGRSRILIDIGQCAFSGHPIVGKQNSKILNETKLTLSHVLLTHWHGDHTGGVKDLVQYDNTLADRIYKNRPDPGQHHIENGDTFRTEGATIRALYTPGHAIVHMCFVFEEENALFTGDNVPGHGYSVSEDLGSYMESLRIMEDQRCEKGYLAHGVEIEDLPRKMSDYIRQKTTREGRIYKALVGQKAKTVKSGGGKGSLTTKELVHSAYGDVPDDVCEMALEPFTTEVLLKLAEDRKVGFEMKAGNKRWFFTSAWFFTSGITRGSTQSSPPQIGSTSSNNSK